MTELETMQRAKSYLDKLANGIDPISDLPVPDADCINQVKVSRCLFYVSDLLRRLIEAGGIAETVSKVTKTPFAITQNELKKFRFDSKPISVSEIAKRINSLVDLETMTKLKYTGITAFLMQCGLLAEVRSAAGKTEKRPTEQGKSIGISVEERTGQNGTYHVTVYNEEAQRFILDHIDAIIEMNAPSTKPAPRQGQPWTRDENEALADLFNNSIPVSEIAATLKRTRSAVRAQLKKLGLIRPGSDAK